MTPVKSVVKDVAMDLDYLGAQIIRKSFVVPLSVNGWSKTHPSTYLLKSLDTF